MAAVESDFDGDGRADVALIAGDGSLHLLQNATETHNNWLLAGLNGIKNLKLAPGAKSRGQDRLQLSESESTAGSRCCSAWIRTKSPMPCASPGPTA